MQRRDTTKLRAAMWAMVMLGATGALPARAAEHITLRNGFELDCTAREVVGDRVRLYTGVGKADYLEVAPEAIAQAEDLPAGASAAQRGAANLIAGDAGRGAGAAPGQASSLKPAALPTVQAQRALPDVQRLASDAGRLHNIDADLLSSIIRAESGGHVRAVSPKGARGLMQLMPATATAMGVADSFEPEQNVAGGAAYLDRLLTMYHNDLLLAVAAYNAGPGAVARWHGVPPYRETREYVARVVREFNRRKLQAQ